MNIVSFLAGFSVAAFIASALFFYKFWKVSRDRFFLFFNASCILLATDRLLSLFFHATQDVVRTAETESVSLIYLLRLLAFVVIMIGIWDKNRH